MSLYVLVSSCGGYFYSGGKRLFTKRLSESKIFDSGREVRLFGTKNNLFSLGFSLR